MRIQLKRSSVLESGVAKSPSPAQTEHGELCVNFNSNDPALFLKDSANNVIRIAGAGAPGKIDGVTGEAPIVVEEVDENNVVIKFTDAPDDGNQYTRGSQAWNLIETYVKTISGVSPIIVDSTNPQEIQISFDDAPTDGEQYVRKDSGWELVDVPPGTIVSEGFPPEAINGQLWWADTDTDDGGGRLYIYVDGQWIDTSMPGGSAISETEANALYVRKNTVDSQVILGPLETTATVTATGGITGNLSGNATTATTADVSLGSDKVDITSDEVNTTRYLSFTGDLDNGYTSLYGNTELKYYPNTNTIKAAAFDGDLIGNASSATNADKVDNLQATSFIRSDANDTASGEITFNGRVNIRNHIDLSDNQYLYFGSGDDVELFCNGSHMYMDLNSGIGNFYIRDGSTTRFTFDDNGTLTCGTINAAISTTNVTNAIAGSTAGGKGTYNLLQFDGAQQAFIPNSTIAGSSLRYSNCGGNRYTGSRPGGSYRLMGRLGQDSSLSDPERASVFVRYA